MNPPSPTRFLRLSVSVAALLLGHLSGAHAQAGGASPSAVFERATASTWVLETSDAGGRVLLTGNAVALGPGKAITSCQLLSKASRISLKRENVSYGASLEWPDPQRDLCQLQVPNLPGPALGIVDGRDLRVGMPLYVIGAPRGQEMSLNIAMLSSIRRANDGAPEALQLAAAPDTGLGGAGLFDNQGRLAGVLPKAMPDSDARLAIPAMWVADLPSRGARTIQAAAALPKMAAQADAAASPSFRALEYTLRDRITGNTRTVVYRLDPPDPRDGQQRSFNDGGWVEKLTGEVVSVRTPIAGEFDGSTPPGGWMNEAALREREGWSVSYGRTSAGAGSVQLKLDAYVDGTETLMIAGTERKLVRVNYRGYMSRSAMAAGSTAASGVYRASAWWSPELSRVVRFTAHSRGGIGSTSFYIDEEIELSAIR